MTKKRINNFSILFIFVINLILLKQLIVNNFKISRKNFNTKYYLKQIIIKTNIGLFNNLIKNNNI